MRSARDFSRHDRIAGSDAHIHTARGACARRERGLVLLIAIVATIALAYAGIALVRAVATDVAVGTNLAARQQATFAASVAVERAVDALFGAGAIDPALDDRAHHYFASRQGGEDRRGVPVVVQTLADYPPEFDVIDAGDGFLVRHVIERLCLLPGDAAIANCTLSPPSVAAAIGPAPPGEPPRTPFYRVTIRADGPSSTATFVQVMLAANRPEHRLSWRTLDE